MVEQTEEIYKGDAPPPTHEQRNEDFAHVVGTDIHLEVIKGGSINSLEASTGKKFAGFVDTILERNTPDPYYGDFGTRTWLSSQYRDSARILLPTDAELARLLDTRDNRRTDTTTKIDTQHAIHNHIELLLKRRGWVCYTGLSPRHQDVSDPDEFHSAQHIGIPQRDGDKLTGIMILPPGIYHINFPEMVSSGKVQLPKNSLNILKLNREHAFVTLMYESHCIEDQWWLQAHGGQDTLISFPGGSTKDGVKIRYVVQKKVESMSIFFARVFGAYFDFKKGIIFGTDETKIGLIKGAKSEQIRALTEIAIKEHARDYYQGDEVKARYDLAKQWHQKNASQLQIDVQIHPHTTRQGIAALEERLGITLTDWHKPILPRDQMTWDEAEAALYGVIIEAGYAVKPDFISFESKPFENTRFPIEDLVGDYGDSNDIDLADLHLVNNLIITTQNDSQTSLYRLHILGIEEDGIVQVAGMVTTQSGGKRIESFVAGRIRIHKNRLNTGTDLTFLEYGTAENVELLKQLHYADLLSLRLQCLQIWRENSSTKTTDEIIALMQSSLPTNVLRMHEAGIINNIKISLKDQAIKA